MLRLLRMSTVNLIHKVIDERGGNEVEAILFGSKVKGNYVAQRIISLLIFFFFF